jgi:hypothetical protein
MVEVNALPDYNDLLVSKSVPSLSFKDVPAGHSYEGIITDLRTVEVRNFDDPTKVETWEDGKPKLQIEVTLATEYADPDNADDDGSRRVYLFGQKLTAAKAEMKAKGFDKLEKGFKFTITFTGEKPASNKRYNPVKLYAITLEQGKSNPDVDAILADAGAKPVKAKAEDAKLSDEQIAKVQKLASNGFDAEEIADALKVNKYAVVAVLEADLI